MTVCVCVYVWVKVYVCVCLFTPITITTIAAVKFYSQTLIEIFKNGETQLCEYAVVVAVKKKTAYTMGYIYI